MSLLVVGSIALDTVKTPVEEHADLLGGSASYAALSASFFTPVNLVGVVGDDFPESAFEFWKSHQIDTTGVQRVNGKTFRWSGEYAWDLNTRETRSVALNVFETFSPELPANYRATPLVLLANIAPKLQSHVLDQMERPRYVAIKKGEHGALLFGEDEFFSAGAYPLEDIHDPTGAGDTFAGGFAGYLAAHVQENVTFDVMRKAVIYGSVLASFCVEAFSLERLRKLTQDQIADRYQMFKMMSQFEVLT